jgi:hypothetical protein
MKEFEVIRKAHIDGEFEGFDDEVLFKLDDGSYWIQDEYLYWYHYAYFPNVSILKRGQTLFIQVDGQNQIVSVRQIFDVIESKIDGEFSGWEGDTEYALTNGQVWKQTKYKYEYKYAYMPDVTIYEASSGMRMIVEGTSSQVRRIR